MKDTKTRREDRHATPTDYKALPVVLLLTAFKWFRLPKPIMYAGYMLIKNRQIWVVAKIKGSNLPIRLNLGDFIQYWIFVNGIYEEPLYRFLRQRLKGKVFLDIGANIGNFIFSMVDEAKVIYAFEASKANCALMRENIARHHISNVDVIHKAVTAKDRSFATLYISKDAQGNNSMYTAGESRSERVETITLDTFVKQQTLKAVDYIKVDVEGAELEVLRGAEQTLKSFKPVLIVEFNSAITNVAGYDLATLYDVLIGFGYVGFSLSGRRTTRAMVKEQRQMNENLYFIHKNRAPLDPV
jgi:FkbM family methyltransferase